MRTRPLRPKIRPTICRSGALCLLATALLDRTASAQVATRPVQPLPASQTASIRTAHPASSQPTARSVSTERQWYGWQIIVGDVTAFSLMSAGFFSGGGPSIQLPLSVVGVLTYFSVGPIIHWVHGSTGLGFASMFGFRLGFAGIGLIVGLVVDLRTGGGFSGPGALMVEIAGVTALVGGVLDSLVAWRQVPLATSTSAWRFPTRGTGVSSMLSVGPHPLTPLGLSVWGRF